jgi:moderate conductance mechanosensitive channel
LPNEHSISSPKPLLFVKDAGLAEPRVLLTVTDTDAQYHVTTKEILAARWQKLLEKELRQALELRKPGALRQQINDAIKIAIAAIASSIFLWLLSRVLEWREKALAQYQVSQASQAIAPVSSDEESDFRVLVVAIALLEASRLKGRT